uniref:Uncharacterized protein n=1 Tax=Arion vulgaris TaxID=1028688 RepID=A0A0B6ZJM9_9EUPU
MRGGGVLCAVQWYNSQVGFTVQFYCTIIGHEHKYLRHENHVLNNITFMLGVSSQKAAHFSSQV